ncbi:MAG: N-6 DNA methylase [Planctomycetia bacterium]|nr:N-6 DNA methylase [Planctomycetia bacterium]
MRREFSGGTTTVAAMMRKHQDRCAYALSIKPTGRRRDGIFFTGSSLAESVSASLGGRLSRTSVITDPACGSGDLLIACARHLPKKRGLWETLTVWERCLQGADIHQEFVDSTKLRLVLQAVALGADRTRIRRDEITRLFPKINVGNGLTAIDKLKNSTHVVTNPPFAMVSVSSECEWTSGIVNSAAVFLDVTTRSIEPGTRVLAILPDVLRSGSRYLKWRELIASRLTDVSLSMIGQFSRYADVDVFVLRGKKRASVTAPSSSASLQKQARHAVARSTVGDRYIVHVGPVVPHRHKRAGKSFPYLTPQNSPPWETVTKIDTHRRFSGSVFRPPFVVVRRTSRPGDRHRAVCTIITGHANVAVENHLILLIPHARTLHACQELLRLMKSPQTNRWLNHRMCCRHLTVSAVKSIPWTLESA